MTHPGSRTAIALLLLLAGSRALGAQATAGRTYHVAQKIQLGGEGGWDYLTVDTARARLFITRSDRVMVVDQASGKKLYQREGCRLDHCV